MALSLQWQGFFSVSQLKRWHGALGRRFSCRAFSGPADLSQSAALHYAAQRCCLPGTRIEVLDRDAEKLILPLPLFPRFENVCQYAVLMVNEDLPHARLLAGISGEAFALEAAAMDLGLCWVIANYNRALVRTVKKDGEKILGVLPLGKPKDPEGAKNRKRKALQAICIEDPAQWPAWAYQVAEAVRSAPSAMNRQPWKLSYNGKSLRLDLCAKDSLDDGIALLHMECAAYAQIRNWRYSADQKGILLQIEDHDEPV